MTFKKLAKYIIIGAIFKLILYFFCIILSFNDIVVIYLYLLVWIFLVYSFFYCKNKVEYITTLIILAGFWYIVSNIFTYELLDFPFFAGVLVNYTELSFDFSNNFLDPDNKNLTRFDCLSKDIKLIKSDVYDISGSVEKLNNPLYLENTSGETEKKIIYLSEETEEINYLPSPLPVENLDRKDYINNIKLESKILNIKDLRSSSILSQTELLTNLLDNYSKYTAEDLKFRRIIDDIDMGRENFYPPNARDLFIQYLELIPVLIENINESVGNLLPPLPEQTEEEINLLLNPSPEQTEETKFLEAEDYMEDIINLNWFSEKD